MTFDTCTFNSSGKVINVYTDYSAGNYDITVNFKDCTVNGNTPEGKKDKAVMNINDSNMGDYKYIINISGTNVVNGVTPDNLNQEYPDYQAEAALKQDYTCAGIAYTLEGRADGIFTDKDGTLTIDEIKTTTLPPEFITGEQSPEHWAQAQIYAAIYARQQGLPAMRVRLVY